MAVLGDLVVTLTATFSTRLKSVSKAYGEVTVECNKAELISVLYQLRDDQALAFNQLIDLCAVDYLHYGVYDWQTESATESGFSRASAPGAYTVPDEIWSKPRFAVVYHLLSTIHNQRLRLSVFVDEADMVVPSAHEIWKGANWFEREAYDLFGILFAGHPDLRRILTDYGFIGHPLRKDFPLSGHVEMRYDALANKVIYEPVAIEPRITVPKVIREDNRYAHKERG